MPVYVCGPTASGKSALAIELAKQLHGEVVNGDAYQVYQGLETLTAAPSAEELSEVPHHLFSVLSPSENFDAMRYLELAKPVIEEIESRGKSAVIVGGSGMYLKFLTHGPSPVPAGDDSLRAELEQRSQESLVEEFQKLDPEGAAITNLKNPRYVMRALEICLLSGRPMSSIKNEWAKECAEKEKDLKGIVLQWEPEALRRRIAKRTKLMLENGAIEEVRSHPELSATCEKAIGVPQIRSYLNGEIDLTTCEEKIFFATCQYAKRQRTWFKKEQWLSPRPMDAKRDIKSLVSSQCSDWDLNNPI
ncbi:tRNA dimethylallyltransferase [Rubritalea halochordaticola]|uniref:tRNA dimethylallyltransferase n=1 Tax=Rubritalea halochordaticola TaxID=714537 RepID=A0ABP9UX63_9BACT